MKDQLKVKEKIGLAHDCMLYARDYLQNRQLKNNPDNELGKTLKAIAILDEIFNELPITIPLKETKPVADREKIVKELKSKFVIGEKWHDIDLDELADFIIAKLST